MKKKDFTLVKDGWSYVADIIKREKLLIDPDEMGLELQDKVRLLEMVVALHHKFYSLEGGEIIVLEHPKTWWDAFKLRFFSDRLLRAYPAEVKKITIKEVVPRLPKKFKSKARKFEEDTIRFERPYEFDYKETVIHRCG